MNDASSSLPPDPPSPRPMPPARCGCARGCLMAMAALLLGFGGLLLLLVLFAGSLSDSLSSLARSADGPADRGVDEFPPLSEIWSSGSGDVKAVRIPLRGSIFLGDGHGGWTRGSADNAHAALRAIRRATADPSVRGILLEIDSGGGGMTASDVLHQALLRFKESAPDRVVVAHLGNLSASGAYYVSVAADFILAHPTTITGSIGVILPSWNMRELAERLGIRDASVKSGDHKDILSPLADPTEEQTAMLQEIVDRMHSRFVALVAERRGLAPDRVREMADGRILLADQALEAGLLDGLGYTADAEAELARQLDVESVFLVRYQQQQSFLDLLRSPGFWGAALSDAIPLSFGRSVPEWK